MFVKLVVDIWCKEFCDLFSKIFFSALIGFASLIVTVVILCFASECVSYDANMTYNMVSDKKIIALKDNQNVSGNIYLMGGYVDEDLYYYYSTETELGYKVEKIEADNVYIKYTNGEAHIERYEGKFINKMLYIFGLPYYDRYVIYCPEGTVANEFNVDLE